MALPSVSDDGTTTSTRQQLRNLDPRVSNVLLCLHDDAVFFVGKFVFSNARRKKDVRNGEGKRTGNREREKGRAKGTR